jgi:nitrate reductase delta subunit
MKTLKALSALLSYPSPELCAATDEIGSILMAESELDDSTRAALGPLLTSLSTDDLFDCQERYVLLFDRTRSLSLNLFEHVHGESRDRGQAMVDLKSVYDRDGFAIDSAELPDYLPLFLEYCSLRPESEARSLLAEPAHILAVLGERLQRKASPYAAVFAALVTMAGSEGSRDGHEARRSEVDLDPDDLQALDAAWEEEEVTFGVGSAAECGVDSLAARLRQASRPAPGLETARARHPRPTPTHVTSRN